MYNWGVLTLKQSFTATTLSVIYETADLKITFKVNAKYHL